MWEFILSFSVPFCILKCFISRTMHVLVVFPVIWVGDEEPGAGEIRMSGGPRHCQLVLDKVFSS